MENCVTFKSNVKCEKLMWKCRESFNRLDKQVRKVTHMCEGELASEMHLSSFAMCLPIECQITRDKGNFHKHTTMINAEEPKKKHRTRTKTTTTNFFNGICTTFVYNRRRDVVLFLLLLIFFLCFALLWLLSFEKSFYVYIKRCTNAQCIHHHHFLCWRLCSHKFPLFFCSFL